MRTNRFMISYHGEHGFGSMHYLHPEMVEALTYEQIKKAMSTVSTVLRPPLHIGTVKLVADLVPIAVTALAPIPLESVPMEEVG